jgi:hypothetical protein
VACAAGLVSTLPYLASRCLFIGVGMGGDGWLVLLSGLVGVGVFLSGGGCGEGVSKEERFGHYLLTMWVLTGCWDRDRLRSGVPRMARQGLRGDRTAG